MFDENSTIGEAIKTEEGKEVLARNGVPCVGCSRISEEMDFLTIGEVAEKYNLDKKKIINDINKK